MNLPRWWSRFEPTTQLTILLFVVIAIWLAFLTLTDLGRAISRVMFLP